MWLLSVLALALAPDAAQPAATPQAQAETTATSEPPPGQALLPAIDALPPAERAQLQQLLLDMSNTQTPVAGIAVADKLLARVSEPSRLRGMVQFFRAAALAAADREPAALSAIEESIRLLPEHSAPLLAAAGIYAYSHTPGRGADHLLRAAEIDPAAIRSLDEWTIQSLFHRLRAENDKRRVQAVSERLLAIDWQGQRLGAQSKLALDTIKAKLARRDVAGARALVPRLLDPADSYNLLMLRDAEPIWPDIERWAGPKLERQWAIYLREARSRWEASKSPETLADYSTALGQANHDRTLVRTVLPLFDAPDPEADVDLIFEASRLAGALARQGRWADVDAMFVKALKVWPLDGGANALNLASNRAAYLFRAGRTQEAAKQMDEALATVPRWGEQVNADAVRAMHWHKACGLTMAGRKAEAAVSIAAVLGHDRASSKASLRLCMDDREGAKRELLDALRDPDRRDQVISFLQPTNQPGAKSRHSELLYARNEALRVDPELVKGAAPYGRVLPFRVSEGAPAEAP